MALAKEKIEKLNTETYRYTELIEIKYLKVELNFVILNSFLFVFKYSLLT